MASMRRRVNKAKMLFNIERSLCIGRFDELGQLIDITERGMKDRFADWGKWFEERTADCSDLEKQDFIDHYYDDLAMVRDTAPNLMRHAFIVVSISLLEKVVADLCRTLFRVDAIPQRPPSRLYLRDSKKWLMKYASFPELAFASEWKASGRAEALRHAIVHNAGRLPRDSAAIRREFRDTICLAKWHIDHSQGVSLDQYGNILLERSFCDNTLEQARIAYEKLLNRGEKLVKKICR